MKLSLPPFFLLWCVCLCLNSRWLFGNEASAQISAEYFPQIVPDSSANSSITPVFPAAKTIGAQIQSLTSWQFPTITCATSINDPIIFQMTNNGVLSPGRLTAITISGPDSADFSVLQPTSFPASAPSGSILLLLRFNPRQPQRAGARTAMLVTQATDASGIAIPAASLTLNAVKEVHDFTLLLSRYNFPLQLPLTSASVTLPLIRNTGSVPLQWQINNPRVGNFSADNITPNPTPVGGVSSVNITFLGGQRDSVYSAVFPFTDRLCNTPDRPLLVQAEVAQNHRLGITNFAPISGTIGTLVIVTGRGFQDSAGNAIVSGITLGGMHASRFFVLSSTQIAFEVPSGVRQGQIVVITTQGVAFSLNTFTVLVPTRVEQRLYTSMLRCYPNPTHDEIVLELQTTIGELITGRITTVLGQTLLQFSDYAQSAEWRTILNTSSLERGVYVLEIRTRNGVMVEKIIKQ